MGKVKAYGVVGSGYGDEGKGLVTDYLASTLPGGVVVRTNGGAQAGHTVQMADGRRHVFHHLGSGAMAGNPTHLSRYFVSHPILFLGEREELVRKGANVSVSADPRGAVTTPYDMMVNQIVERSRGGARHGSCGLGFGETVGRAEEGEFAFVVSDLLQGVARMRELLIDIRSGWIFRRLEALGVRSVTEEERDIISSEGILDRFIEDCLAFSDVVRIRDDASLGESDVIFEGAQGLMLDQSFGAFPHVTRSNTGAVNMAAVALEAGFGEIDVVYATRTYVTRHGAGPLAHETGRLDFADVVDPTNIPNEWQGAIRFAPLDLDVLGDAVRTDVVRSGALGVRVRPRLAVSCIDQLRGEAVLVRKGEPATVPGDRVSEAISEEIGIALAIEGWGPTRSSVSAADARMKAPALVF